MLLLLWRAALDLSSDVTFLVSTQSKGCEIVLDNRCRHTLIVFKKKRIHVLSPSTVTVKFPLLFSHAGTGGGGDTADAGFAPDGANLGTSPWVPPLCRRPFLAVLFLVFRRSTGFPGPSPAGTLCRPVSAPRLCGVTDSSGCCTTLLRVSLRRIREPEPDCEPCFRPDVDLAPQGV